MEDAKRLSGGVAEWNTWRESLDRVPDLKAQDLDRVLKDEVIGLNLSGMDLSSCHFPKARYHKLNLCGANLTEAVFKEGCLLDGLETDADTIFAGSRFSHCRLTNTVFRTRQFSNMRFSVTSFSQVEFPDRTNFVAARFNRSNWQDSMANTCEWTGCTFASASFLRCSLEESTFTEVRTGETAGFRNARFNHTSLRKSNLTGMDMAGANFVDCDLTNVVGLEFDDNLLQRTLTSPDVDATWSKLRRRYTGINMIFTLLALIAFLLPWVASAGAWLALSNAERSAGLVMQQIEAQHQLPADIAAMYRASGYPQRMNAVQACHSGKWTEDHEGQCLSMALVLTGWHESGLIFSTSILLLIYNALRGYLTYRVGAFRDLEAASYRTPPRSRYGHMKVLNTVVTILAVGAVMTGIFGVYGALTSLIWLPDV